MTCKTGSLHPCTSPRQGLHTMTGDWSLSSSRTVLLPFAEVLEVIVPFFRLLDTPLPRFLFPRLLGRVLDLWSTSSLPFFGWQMEGDGELLGEVPRSVRGESAENKASTLDFPCLSRGRLQRTSPAGALEFFGSGAWLGLGDEFDGLIGGCGSMDPAPGNFVPWSGVL